jgi:hypothetical protein
VRGAQAGALLAGLHVELDLQEICRIAYIRRHTNPHGHDTNTLMELGVDPRVPATAALAIATGTSSAALAALLVTDFDPATGALTLNGDTTAIPNHLVAPIRAQHRRQLRKGYIYLLAGSARTPSAPFIKRLLATHAPRAAAASTRDQALRAYKTAISCHSLQSANDDPTPDGSVCLHPDSLDRWVDALGQRGTQLNARYGPPIREGSERLDRFSSESHQVEALKTLSGVKERVGGPVGWKSQQTVAKDIQLLHAVIVQYGEKIRRGDLYRALGWTAKRTQTALAQLRRHLEPLGETITEEPPDYLIARAIDHTHAERALRVLRSRAQARDGLTAAAAEMLQKMVRVYPGRIAALPDEHPDAAAQAELCQADIASVTGGYVWLDNTVAMTFGNHTYHDGFQRRHDVG